MHSAERSVRITTRGRWTLIAALFLSLIGVLLMMHTVSAQQSGSTYYELDRDHGVTLPDTFEIVQQQTGFLAVRTSQVGLAFYAPNYTGTIPNLPLLTILIDAGQSIGTPPMPDDVIDLQIGGRDAAYFDSEQTYQGQVYPIRIYALRMSDGLVGVISVFLPDPTASFNDVALLIEPIFATFDVIAAENATDTPTDTPEPARTDADMPTPTHTPKPTNTPTIIPTITPTPGPLMPQSGLYTMTITASDNQATCSVGLYPLESALTLMRYTGSLVASTEGSTVDLVLGGNSSVAQNRVHLERTPDTDVYLGSADAIDAGNGTNWSVSLHLELVAPGRFEGHPTTSFTLTDGQNTIHCADNAVIVIESQSR